MSNLLKFGPNLDIKCLINIFYHPCKLNEPWKLPPITFFDRRKRVEESSFAGVATLPVG